jgi:hypothetical protein
MIEEEGNQESFIDVDPRTTIRWFKFGVHMWFLSPTLQRSTYFGD